MTLYFDGAVVLSLTDRYQTTVPETVRRALRLGKRDKIHYTIRPDGEVVLSRVEIQETRVGNEKSSSRGAFGL